MTDDWPAILLPQHVDMLKASGITPEQARARGYVSVVEKAEAARRNISTAGRRVPGLLIPLLRRDGSTWGYQYRPDRPRLNSAGKPVKYETAVGQSAGIDIPPGVAPMLDDPTKPLFITEGSKKGDAGAQAGLCIVALSGVWNWRGTNAVGGKTALAEWDDIALNGRRVVIAFDGDVARKVGVNKAMVRLAGYLETKGATVEYLHLPDTDAKTGLDDYLALGHTAPDLWALVRPEPPELAGHTSQVVAPPLASVRVDPPAVTVEQALSTFRRWLHLPDTDPLLAVAAAAAANRTDDASPVWLLMIGPPSAGKTEQIIGLADLPEAVTAATVTEASLLSGTSAKEKAADATGGLLRQVGRHGLLLMKDFTSVLSQNGDARAAALGALREVYDGTWSRPVGTDGGKLLTWRGKLGVIAGCTNAYDKHYSVISQLGDRFLIVRIRDENDEDEENKAISIGMSALGHGDDERAMRADLTEALAGLVAGADPARAHRSLTGSEKHEVIRLARYAGVSRTPVDRDRYTGELVTIPEPEGPGRLTIAYRQMLGGLEAIGVEPDVCWRVLRRLALDTAPAIRAAVLTVLVQQCEPRRTVTIAQRAGLVTKTAARVLDDLTLIGLAEHTKNSDANNAPDLWAPTALLLRLWPTESRTHIDPPHPEPKEGKTCTTPPLDGSPTGDRQLVSYFPAATAPDEGDQR